MQIMQLTHQKDGIFFVPKVFFGIDNFSKSKKKNQQKVYISLQSCHFLRWGEKYVRVLLHKLKKKSKWYLWSY